MTERVIEIERINPLELYGDNNIYLEQIARLFPKLKLVARGTTLKIIGTEVDSTHFERRFGAFIQYYNRYGHISKEVVEQVFGQVSTLTTQEPTEVNKDVILYGNSGNIIRARTPNQLKLVKLYSTKDLLFAVGPAGSGKTYTAIALAVRALKNKEVKRIIMTRPAVEAGEKLGFLPGDMKEKLDPYLQPLYDALHDMIPAGQLTKFIDDGTIQIAPLAFMRGRTLDHAAVILDEAQNTTLAQMKMFLTRMGRSAKFIVTGDATQVDLPRREDSGLIHALRLLEKVKGIGIVEFGNRDIIRHDLVKSIVDAFGQEQQ